MAFMTTKYHRKSGVNTLYLITLKRHLDYNNWARTIYRHLLAQRLARISYCSMKTFPINQTPIQAKINYCTIKHPLTYSEYKFNRPWKCSDRHYFLIKRILNFRNVYKFHLKMMTTWEENIGALSPLNSSNEHNRLSYVLISLVYYKNQFLFFLYFASWVRISWSREKSFYRMLKLITVIFLTPQLNYRIHEFSSVS